MTHKTTHGQHCVCHSCHPHTLRPARVVHESHLPLPAQSPEMRGALDVWERVNGGLRSGS